MAHANQLAFIQKNKALIKEPILIIGSKQYNYDQYNINSYLQSVGFTNITGIDIEAGECVDVVMDIAVADHPIFSEKAQHFNTVFCMEVLTHISNPFVASTNVNRMLQTGATVFLSESIVRKISRMPLDLWRFTYDGLKQVFNFCDFDESRAARGITRMKTDTLVPYDAKVFEVLHDQHAEENAIGHFLRRLHRKFFARGVFHISRLMPEQTFYAVGKKR